MNKFSAIEDAINFIALSDDELKTVTYYEYWIVSFKLRQLAAEMQQSINEIESAGGLLTPLDPENNPEENMHEGFMAIFNNTQGPLLEFVDYLQMLTDHLTETFERWEGITREAECAS